jgi:hypothetical protein
MIIGYARVSTDQQELARWSAVNRMYTSANAATVRGLGADHGQKRELGGVTIGEQLTSTGPLQKAVYSLTRRSQHFGRPKFTLAFVGNRRIIQPRGHSCTDPHGQAAVWAAANSVGPLLHADAHPPG